MKTKIIHIEDFLVRFPKSSPKEQIEEFEDRVNEFANKNAQFIVTMSIDAVHLRAAFVTNKSNVVKPQGMFHA